MFLMLLSCSSFSQGLTAFTISIGSSTNDQAEKRFLYEHREWKYENKNLSYNIDIREKRYVDTLLLNDSIYNRIAAFIKENDLLRDYEIELKSSFPEKDEYSEFISARFIYDAIAYEVSVKAEGYGQIEINKVAQKLKELEHLLYKAVE